MKISSQTTPAVPAGPQFISDTGLRRLSGTLCLASVGISVIALPLLFFRAIHISGALGTSMGFLIGFPIQGGIIFTGWVITLGFFSSSFRWDGPVSEWRLLALLAVCGLGLLTLLFGFFGEWMPAGTPAAIHESRVSAYFEDGTCLAVLNKAKPVAMPGEFCENFNLHFVAAFCGFWMFFSAPLHYLSLLRRTR